MSLTANERLARAGYALALAQEEGATDSGLRQQLNAEAKKHLRAVLRQSDDGKRALEELDTLAGASEPQITPADDGVIYEPAFLPDDGEKADDSQNRP